MNNILVRKIAYAYFIATDATREELKAVAEHGDIDNISLSRGWDVMDGEYEQSATLIGPEVVEGSEELERLTSFSAFQRDLVRDNGHFDLATVLMDLDRLVKRQEKEQSIAGDALDAINRARTALRLYVHGKES